MDRYQRSNDSIVQKAGSGIQTYMAQVYGWMTCGLLLVVNRICCMVCGKYP